MNFLYGVFFTLGIQVFGVFILYKILECTARYQLGTMGEMFFRRGKKIFTEIMIPENPQNKKEQCKEKKE